MLKEDKTFYAHAVNKNKIPVIEVITDFTDLQWNCFQNSNKTKKTLNSSIYLHLLWIWIRENQSAVTKGKWEHTLGTHPASSQTYSHINRTKGVSFTSAAYCLWSHGLTSPLSFNETQPLEVHCFKQSLLWFLYMSPIAQQSRYKQKAALQALPDSCGGSGRVTQQFVCTGESVFTGGKMAKRSWQWDL